MEYRFKLNILITRKSSKMMFYKAIIFPFYRIEANHYNFIICIPGKKSGYLPISVRRVRTYYSSYHFHLSVLIDIRDSSRKQMVPLFRVDPVWACDNNFQKEGCFNVFTLELRVQKNTYLYIIYWYIEWTLFLTVFCIWAQEIIFSILC